MSSAPTTTETFFVRSPSGKYTFFVDATLIKDFKICELRFYRRHVLNLRPKVGFVDTLGQKHEYGSFPMVIGGWWSEVMDAFYQGLKAGKKDFALKDITDITVKAWADNHMDEAALRDPKRFASFGDLAGAALMLKEYYDRQFFIDSKNWKILATEAGFGFDKEIYVGASPDGTCEAYWVGKPDLSVVENDRVNPVDHKTVGRIDGRTIDKYKPGVQMPGYIFAHEVLLRELGYRDLRVDRCIVNICARSRPSDNPRDGKKKPRFIRAYPSFNGAEIEEWRRGIVRTCERLRRCLETNEWEWNEGSCHNVFMRDCEFKKVDGSVPGARDIVLAAEFETGEPWRPYSPIKDVEDEDE